MTPDERDRLVRLEQQASDTRDDIAEIKDDVKKLLSALYMGKGSKLAWAKIGGMAITILAATGWLYDHFVQPLIGKH